MKRMFIPAALASMCMISCEMDEIIPGPAVGETVLLNVSVPAVATKATGVSDASEDAVHNLQVFVFREDGSLDAYASKDNSQSLTISTTTGQKDIVAVANAPAVTDVSSLSVLNAKVTYLQDNAPGKFIMTGSVKKEITQADAAVEIGVARRVARIYLTQVTNDFSSEVYRSKDFRITKIYLVDAAGSTGYFSNLPAEVMYNEGKLDESQENASLKALLQDEQVGVKVDYGTDKAYAVPHYFYCYPNAGTAGTEETAGGLKCTKLVLETTLDGKTYYYPVPVGNIMANHRYSVKVRVTRPGSDSPDKPVSFDEASVTVTVTPWKDGADTDITI